MGLRKKFLLGFIFVSFALVLLFNTPVSVIKAADEGGANFWKWSDSNPKPAWFKWDSGKEKPVRGGYIKWAASRYIGLMNPNHWPVYDWVSMTQLYEDLFYIQGDWKPNFPWLAESYTYPDPLTCIMKFRQGIKFHDGTDFDAEAVKFTLDYIMDKKNGCWTKAWVRPIKSMEVLDKYTLKWNFSEPWAAFIGMMGTTPGYIISKKALEGDMALKELENIEKSLKTAQKKVERAAQKADVSSGEEKTKALEKLEKEKEKLADIESEHRETAKKAEGAFSVDNHAVGTGRYMFEEGRPGNYLKMKRNPDWWFGKTIGQPDMPYPDGIIVKVIADLYSMGLSPSQFNMLKGDRNLKITSMTQNHLVALRFNTQNGPCKDLRVRKAISHAIDRKALIFGTQFGQAEISSCMYMNSHWCHNPELKPVTYDPELSKNLLREAGYEKGLTVTGYMPNLPDSMPVAEAIKDMLAQVDIKWDVDFLDNVASSDRMKNVEYDLAQGGWAYIKDPDMMASGLYHPDGGFNYGRSNNPEAIKLIEAGVHELDENKRQKIYWELEKLLYENYEDAWLWNPILSTARRENLLGYDVELHKIGQESYWFSHPEWLKDGKE